MSGISRTTTDHEIIARWAEARGGAPTRVAGTEQRGAGLLRIAFPDHTDSESLEPISWGEFFEAFEQKSLALTYQEATSDGHISRFNRLVTRAAS